MFLTESNWMIDTAGTSRMNGAKLIHNSISRHAFTNFSLIDFWWIDTKLCSQFHEINWNVLHYVGLKPLKIRGKYCSILQQLGLFLRSQKHLCNLRLLPDIYGPPLIRLLSRILREKGSFFLRDLFLSTMI